MRKHTKPFKLTAHAGSGSALHWHRLPAGSPVKLNKLDLWPTSDLETITTRAHGDTCLVWLRGNTQSISSMWLGTVLTRTARYGISPVQLGTVSH